MSDEDRQRLRELFTPSDSLTFVVKEGEVDLTDTHERRRIFYTDGRKLQKSKDAYNQEIAAHWEQGRLVSEEKAPGGGNLIRSFSVSSDGNTLNERIHLENGRSGSSLDLRYVYDFVREEKP